MLKMVYMYFEETETTFEFQGKYWRKMYLLLYCQKIQYQ